MALDPRSLQAKVIKTTKTLPQMLMPLKLSSARRALHALITGKQPTAVAAQHGAAAAPLAFRDGGAMPSLPGPRPSGLGGGAGTAVLERPRPTDEVSARGMRTQRLGVWQGVRPSSHEGTQLLPYGPRTQCVAPRKERVAARPRRDAANRVHAAVQWRLLPGRSTCAHVQVFMAVVPPRPFARCS